MQIVCNHGSEPNGSWPHIRFALIPLVACKMIIPKLTSTSQKGTVFGRVVQDGACILSEYVMVKKTLCSGSVKHHFRWDLSFKHLFRLLPWGTLQSSKFINYVVPMSGNTSSLLQLWLFQNLMRQNILFFEYAELPFEAQKATIAWVSRASLKDPANLQIHLQSGASLSRDIPEFKHHVLEKIDLN